MTRFAKIFFAAFALLALASIAANAQHLISTKAGFVNRAEGKVFILRADSLDGEKGRASLGTQMRDGDRIFTEAGSFAEVLLSPGSYLRMNENSEIRAISTSLTQIRFEVVKGAAIAEVATATEQVSTINKNSPLEIVTPHGTVSIAKDGLYRLDLVETNTLVQVRQGELYIGDRDQFLANKAMKIKRGNAVKLIGGPVSKSDIAKVNKDVSDGFDAWSFNRANTLMAANVSALRRSRTMNSLAYGWIYDSFYNCYTFIPGRGMWYSPYGFGFFNSYSGLLYYWPYGYYPYYGNPYGSGYGGGGGGSVNLPSRVIAGNDRAPIQRQIEGRRIDTGSAFGADRGSADFGSRSIATPSTSSSISTISSSAPTRSEAPAASSGGRAAPPTRP
ncbi:MAG: FecR domain-containing protein [Acidobacteria bacterium]|nr:FecR domain-containing protein [Acidobacteriota bacterium]